MKYKSILILLAALAVTALVAQNKTDINEIRQHYPERSNKETTRLSTTARGIISANSSVILDGSTGKLTNPNATSVNFGEDVSANAPTDGGNLGAANTFIGVANTDLIPFDAVLPNGTTLETLSLMDDTPTGEFSALSAVGAAPTLSASSTIARIGSNSLKAAFTAAAAAGDGFSDPITSGDWEAEESVGVWIYASEALAAGDLTLVLTDDGGARTYNVPAVATANKWTWVEIDISGLTGGTGDAITEVAFKLSSAGATAHGAFNVWLDGAWKWDATAEKALGVDLIDAPGAVRSFLTITRANTGTHGMTKLTENTDFFIHSESGNDFLVFVGDQSANSGLALVNHK